MEPLQGTVLVRLRLMEWDELEGRLRWREPLWSRQLPLSPWKQVCLGCTFMPDQVEEEDGTPRDQHWEHWMTVYPPRQSSPEGANPRDPEPN